MQMDLYRDFVQVFALLKVHFLEGSYEKYYS